MPIVLQFAIYPGLSMIYTVKKETYSNTPAIKKKMHSKCGFAKLKFVVTICLHHTYFTK